jgi:hypothetical protein
MAEMRPLIAAEPIFRAPNPEIVAELYGICCPETLARAKQNSPILIAAR